MIVGAAACAVLGFAVGLFLNVVIDRTPNRQPLRPLRFRCPRCPMLMKAKPGIPLAQWARPGGRCTICGNPLPRRYFVVPLLNAVLFAVMALRFEADWALPAYLVFVSALLALSTVDFMSRIIPNYIVYPAIFASVPLLAAAAVLDGDLSRFGRAFAAGTVAWIVMLLIYRFAPAGGMGFGDVRLSFLLGLFLGWLGWGHVFIGMFLGFGVGAVLGVVLIVFRLKKMRDHLAFGPLLSIGAVLGVLWGNQLVRAWLG